jgi:hypothetical protein
MKTVIKMEPTKQILNEEEGIYGATSREELVDGDELTPEEAGFMKGYMES